MEAAQGKQRRCEGNRFGPISLDAVRARYVPPEKYRITRSIILPGGIWGGSRRRSTVYIVSGSCVFAFDSDEWKLMPGDVAELPEGSYRFWVEGETEGEYIQVFELPENLWRRQSPS